MKEATASKDLASDLITNSTVSSDLRCVISNCLRDIACYLVSPPRS